MQDKSKEIEEFLSYLKIEKGYSNNTIYAYRDDLEQFLDFLAILEKNLFQIGRGEIRLFLSSLLKKGYKIRSITRKLSTLKSFYKHLLMKNKIQKNPAKLVKTPKIPKELPHFLSEEKVEELFNILEKGENIEIVDRVVFE